MSLLPSKYQWKAWSTLQKWGALASIVAVLTFVIFVADWVQNIFDRLSHIDPKQSVSIQLHFPYERLINGAVTPKKNNPELVVTNTGVIPFSPIAVDSTIFVLTPSLDKVTKAITLSNINTGHQIFEPELKPGLSVKRTLLGIMNWVQPVAYRVSVEPTTSDYKSSSFSVLFLVDEKGIRSEGNDLSEATVKKINAAILAFKKVPPGSTGCLVQVLPNSWVMQAESGVIRTNKDGSVTLSAE